MYARGVDVRSLLVVRTCVKIYNRKGFDCLCLSLCLSRMDNSSLYNTYINKLNPEVDHSEYLPRSEIDLYLLPFLK